jgi:plasmid replication initiation protein
MNKGHIEFKPYTPMDIQTVFELQVTAEKMYNALKVVLESEKLKSLFEVNDKMAYEQVKKAVEDYEYKLFHI